MSFFDCKDGNCLLQDIFKSVEAGDSCPLLTRSWGSALRPRGMAFCSPFPRVLPVLVFLQAGFWVTVRFASLPLTQTVAVITFIRARGPSVIAGLQSGAGRRRPELAWRIPCRWTWAVCGWPMGCEQEQTPSARCPVSPGLSRDTHGDHEGDAEEPRLERVPPPPPPPHPQALLCPAVHPGLSLARRGLWGPGDRASCAQLFPPLFPRRRNDGSPPEPGLMGAWTGPCS